MKINQLHFKDEEADAALNDSDRERIIMEEEKYYEDLDEHKIEDEEERKKRNDEANRERIRQRLYEMAPLRYKMKIKF